MRNSWIYKYFWSFFVFVFLFSNRDKCVYLINVYFVIVMYGLKIRFWLFFGLFRILGVGRTGWAFWFGEIFLV